MLQKLKLRLERLRLEREMISIRCLDSSVCRSRRDFLRARLDEINAQLNPPRLRVLAERVIDRDRADRLNAALGAATFWRLK